MAEGANAHNSPFKLVRLIVSHCYCITGFRDYLYVCCFAA